MTVESRPDFAANGRQTPMKIWLWYASKGCYRFWQLYSDFLRRWNPCKKPPVTREILSATNAQKRYHKKISLLMQGPCDAYGWYFDLDRSPCPRRENSTSSHQEHLRLCGEGRLKARTILPTIGSPPLARGRHFKSYIYTRSLPTSSFTLFLVTQENDSPLSFSASPKFFHTTISLLAQKCNCFVYFYQEFSYVSPKTIPFVPLFFDFIWYNREQRLGAFPRPLYSIFKKG